MDDLKVGVLSCSGEECLGGTLARMATRKVMEQNPGKVVTLCLPLYIAGGEEERSFAKKFPVISVDGCDKRCAKRATIKFSGDVRDTVIITDLLDDKAALGKPVSMRDLKDEHDWMAEQIADAIGRKIETFIR